jgi:polar amino acid transport system substrate-binding protein
MIKSPVRTFILCIAAIFLSGCAGSGAHPEAVSRLAPGGKLRVGLVMDARELVVPEAGSAEVRGPAMDLGRSLAARLGVAFEPVRFQNFAALRAAANDGRWDVAFVDLGAALEAGMAPGPALIQAEVAYLAPRESKLRSIADIDQAGIRVALVGRSGTDRVVGSAIRSATLIRTPSTGHALAQIRLVQAEAMADTRNVLVQLSERFRQYAVLDGSAGTVRFALVPARADPVSGAFLTAFSRDAVANGYVRAALDAAKLRSVEVARD